MIPNQVNLIYAEDLMVFQTKTLAVSGAKLGPTQLLLCISRCFCFADLVNLTVSRLLLSAQLLQDTAGHVIISNSER